MRYPVTALAALLLTGCATLVEVPQTPNQFSAAVRKGASFSQHETLELNRDHARVLSDVRQKTDKCLSVKVTSTTVSGLNRSSGSSTFAPRTRMLGPGKAQFTLQVTYTPKPVGSTMPGGGYYQLVVDIDKIAAGKTRLSLYGPSIGPGNRAYQAIKTWADGKDAPCPDMK
jgi:hypothetical protein